MKNCQIIIASAFLSIIAAPLQAIDVACEAWNPKTTIKFTDNGFNEKGVGEASSAKQQFNINFDASKGAIFVDAKNNGVCKVTLPTGYRITGGHAVIAPNDVWTGWVPDKSPDPKPEVIKSFVTTPFKKTGATTGEFSFIFKGDPAMYKGTINATLIINYEKVH